MNDYRRSVLLLIASMILTFAAGCKSNPGAPANLNCPSGSQLMGQAPPAGDEQWCQKTINGEAVKDGPMVIYRGGGLKMMEGYYKDGKQDGAWTLYYESGGKKSIDHYKDGVQTGAHLSWYEDGQMDAKGQYKEGQPDGVWKRWDPDGVRNWEETYKDGKKLS